MRHDAQQREHPDPREMGRPIPRIVLGIVLLTLLWALSYILIQHPDTTPEWGDSRQMAELMTGTVIGSKVDGAQIFSIQCAACHQATGAGLPGIFPSLTKSERIKGKPTIGIHILLHGISGKLTSGGASYNGMMPGFKDKLNDDEIAAVLTYVRNNFGNHASAIIPTEVEIVRDATKERHQPWNGDAELDAL